MKKQPDELAPDTTSLRDKIVGLSESSGRKSYYPMLQQKIRELQGEIGERERAENALRETLARIARQQTAIAEISTHPSVFHGRLTEAAPMITVRMAQALEVERTSLWIFRDEKLCCVDKFLVGMGKHVSGYCLEQFKYPKYFKSLSDGPIAAVDACHDPRTAEFTDSYLSPHDVAALLDVPVHVEGRLVAVICFEHSSTRTWWPDEITFAGRIADQVALILAGEGRRLAEEQLREAHATLQRNLRFTEVLLDAMPIPVFYKDSQRRYLGCNRTFAEVMGYDAQELRGKTARELWPELSAVYDDNDTLLFSTGGRDVYESRIRDKSGQTRDVIFAKQVFYDADNHIGGLIGSFLDITERNRSAMENQRLRSLLSNIINSMPSVLIGVDENGCIAQWNQQAAQTTGVPEEFAQGKPLDTVVPWLRPELPKVRQAIASKRPFFDGKLSRVENGETFFEDVTIYPLVTNGVEGAVIRIDDVTDKVRIEEMLIQSEKMLSVGGLAAGMAHEINNPLASIMGNAQVVETRLLRDLPQNQAAAQSAGLTLESLNAYLNQRGIPKMLESIRNSGMQAAQIVTNMLNFSRKSDSVLIPEDVRTLLDKTVELASTDYNLKKKYDFKKIAVRREYSPEVPKIMVSPSKLQQVFLNLLRNGAEAMAEKSYHPETGPTFTLRIRTNGPWVRIEIEDNGPGLEESVRKRIFEPFFTTKAIGKGTGLGLSVSYFIISEGHGGLMGVQSAPGEWTRFVIDLPTAPTVTG